MNLLFNRELFFEHFDRFMSGKTKAQAIEATGLSASTLYRLNLRDETAVTMVTVEKLSAAMKIQPHFFLNAASEELAIDDHVVRFRAALSQAGFNEKLVERAMKALNNALFAIGHPVAWED